MLLIFLTAFMGNTFRNRIGVEIKEEYSRAITTVSHGSYPDFIYKDPSYQYFMHYDDPKQPEYGSSFENFSNIFWARFKAEPGRYLHWYLLGKPVALWSWKLFQGDDVYVYKVSQSLYNISPPARLSYDFMKWSHSFILILALLGSGFLFYWIIRRRKIHQETFYPLTLFIILGYYTLLFIIFAPWSRYSVPLRPELYIYAIWSLYNLVTVFQSKSGLNKIPNSKKRSIIAS